MLDRGSQPVFSAALKYFRQGNHAAFQRVCELTLGDVATVDKYLSGNLYASAQIAGLIDTGEDQGKFYWVASFNSDIEVQSSKGKVIGTTKQWFDENPEADPIIWDMHHRPLLYGKRRFKAA